MESNTTEINVKDDNLWKIAKKKVGFKYQLFIYVITIVFFWILWYFNLKNNAPSETGLFPWPLWPMCILGIGVLFNYFKIYKSTDSLTEREYQKLNSINNNSNNN